MTLANEHWCPGCNSEAIPVWRALCRECFDVVPWELRADFMHAYRRRVLHQREYQEKLIEVRQWMIRVKMRYEEGE